jgi:hypothetical protein
MISFLLVLILVRCKQRECIRAGIEMASPHAQNYDQYWLHASTPLHSVYQKMVKEYS